MKFGNAGAYEKINGRLHYSVGPGNPANSRIIDLKYAPKNEKGMVEFVGEFILLKPVNLHKSNHRGPTQKKVPKNPGHEASR